MKKLLIILLFVASGFAAKCQTGTFNFDPSPYMGISGGDSTSAIVSYQWSTSGTQAGPVTIVNPKAKILVATVTTAGAYLFSITITSNTGKAATSTLSAWAYAPQTIYIDLSKSRITTTLQ